MSKFPVHVTSAFDPLMAGDRVLVGAGSCGDPGMSYRLVIGKEGAGPRM